MTLDEQMAAIERLVGDGEVYLPYVDTEDGVRDNASEHITGPFCDVDQRAYLVACANAAPDLCAEVRRLRALLAPLLAVTAATSNYEKAWTKWNEGGGVSCFNEHQVMIDAVREFEKGGEW